MLEYGTVKFDDGCVLVVVELKKHIFFPNSSDVPFKRIYTTFTNKSSKENGCKPSLFSYIFTRLVNKISTVLL